MLSRRLVTALSPLRPAVLSSRSLSSQSAAIPPAEPLAPVGSEQVQGTAQPETSQPTLPYNVPRTSGGALPVYSYIRQGGSRQLTLIRKTQGDLQALKRELVQDLGVEAYVKPQARQVVVRGNWVGEVKSFLAARGL